jgi:acyl carrier protein
MTPPASNARARLERCFAAVFPDLPADAIAQARMDALPAWDSLATVTLVSVVEEEFGVRIDLDEPDALEGLDSFEALLARVERAAMPAV